MQTNYLLPYSFKKAGWFLFVPGIILGIYYMITEAEPPFLDVKVFSVAASQIMEKSTYFGITENNIFNEIIAILIILGALFIAFSKEKQEDEFIAKIRLESLVWATYINYAVLIIALFFIYDLAFLWVFIFNMFTILFFFIIRFNWVLFKSKKALQDEK